MYAGSGTKRVIVFPLSIILFLAYLLQASSPSSAFKAGEGKLCLPGVINCHQGLQCGSSCLPEGKLVKRCLRIQPTIPTSMMKGLPFNKYTWLTTHNSFASGGLKSHTGVLLAPRNQQDSITRQLRNGVRGLMLDMYDFKNDIWLCHSFKGVCHDYTAFRRAIGVLKEVRVFLEANPSEIITIIIEDYVKSTLGLTNLFKAAGLTKFLFPLTRMPLHGKDWPTVDDMVQQNQRLVVFTSKKSKEHEEGIAYVWNYIVENQYGNGGMAKGSCLNRVESDPMNTVRASLILQNYFPSFANIVEACKHNSAPLIDMMHTCYKASGDRWPNFIAVDFYKKSDGRGAARAVDMANSCRICGSNNITDCKAYGEIGKCPFARSSVTKLQHIVTVICMMLCMVFYL